MSDTMSYQQWIGRKLVGPDGSKIGRIDQIYVDEQSHRPAWMTVHTGLFGTRTSFVPLHAATPSGDDVAVPYTKDDVKGAPTVDRDGRLDPAEEQELYRHYSMHWSGGTSDAGRSDGSGRRDSAMTRSEEELRVGKESVETGRARLHKYVETEDVQTTIPVSREELRVEREPITDTNRGAALRGPEISEGEHEVVLHEERPVVAKDVVPKERVRLDKDVVTEERTISDQVRKEQIEMEGTDGDGRRRRPER